MYDQSFHFKNEPNIIVNDPNDIRFLLIAQFSEKSDEEFLFMLEKCWKISPLDTIILLFYIRDKKEGKGNRPYFLKGMKWIAAYHPEYIEKIVPLFPLYGTYKDIWLAFCDTTEESCAVAFYAKKLEDVHNNTPLQDGELIIKYAPREGSSFDRRYGIVGKICKQLKITKADYRKKYIKTLSQKYPSVETKMCGNDWGKIDYSSVPSYAFMRYKNSFLLHDKERFEEYISLSKTKSLAPEITFSDIVCNYTKENVFHSIQTKNLYLEEVWNNLLQKTKHNGILSNILCVMDLSGSMHCKRREGLTCFSIAFALSVASSSLYHPSSPFFGKWINYSANPSVQTFYGDFLYEKINTMDMRIFDNSLDIDRLYMNLLDFCIGKDVHPSQLPNKVVVLTDASLEHQYYTNRTLNWKSISDAYHSKGYFNIPHIIFWNITSQTLNEVPIYDSTFPFCGKLEGYSPSLFDEVVRGIILTPMVYLHSVLNGERYEPIKQKIT